MDIQTLVSKAGNAQRLGQLIGVARTTVLDWERTGFIPGNRVGQISSALKIPIEELVKLVQPGKVRNPEEGAKPLAASASTRPRTKRPPDAEVTSETRSAKRRGGPKRKPAASSGSDEPNNQGAPFVAAA